MKTKKIILYSLLALFFLPCLSQEISRKARREKDKILKVNLIDSLMNSKEFVYEATQVMPLGGAPIHLTGNSNFVKFHPDSIESYMPFFGRAYSIDYGGDGGIKFEGKPVKYTITKLKEGRGYEIDATVPVPRDIYQLRLIVSPDGSATLSINSNSRSAISYYGDIVKFEETIP